MLSRAFNKVSVAPGKQYLVKSSSNCQKLKDEINYYLSLPSELNRLFPEFLHYSDDYSAYTLKYYPYENLGNLFYKSAINIGEGQKIIADVVATADEIHAVKNSQEVTGIVDFYIEKTLSRVLQLKGISSLNTLLESPYLTINQKLYKNFNQLKQEFIASINKNTLSCTMTAIHGDFCFSNILYSPKDKVIKLIDPRGSFGNKGIYGDKNYDFAKLMHCLHGRYDYLVNDNFSLGEVSALEYNFSIPKNKLLDELYPYYVALLTEKAINLELIYLIEASLFLSMIPLHYENPNRQKILYLTGIITLNDVLNGYYAN